MTFPSTPLLDDFNRSENPLSTNWAQGRQSAAPLLANGSAAAASAPASATPASSRRTDVTPLNSEAWVTISNLGGAGGSYAKLFARQQTSGTFAYQLSPSTGGTIAISDVKSNVVTQRASVLRTFGDGEKLGIQVAYSGAIVAVYGWLYTGGAWQTTPIVTWYDSAADRIVTAGEIELVDALQTSGILFDDFGGGETVVAPVQASLSGTGAPTALRDITKSLGYRGLGAFGSYTERPAKWQFNIGNSDGLAPGYDASVDGWRGTQNNQLVGYPISGDPLKAAPTFFGIAVQTRIARSNARGTLNALGQGAYQTQIGDRNRFTGSGFVAQANRLRVGGPWTATIDGQISQAVIPAGGFAGQTARWRALVYSDNGGNPGTLIAVSNEIGILPPFGTPFHEHTAVFPTPFRVKAGDAVWIGLWENDNQAFEYDRSSSGKTSLTVLSTYSTTASPPTVYPVSGATVDTTKVPTVVLLFDDVVFFTRKNVGVWPPLITTQPAPPLAEITTVMFAARERMMLNTRRMPLQGFTAAGPLLGVRPPAATGPVIPFLAAPIDLTLQAVAKRIADRRRQPIFEFIAPNHLGLPPPPPPPVVTTLTVAFATSIVRSRIDPRRRPTVRLAPPTVLQTFTGPQVTLVAARTRTETSRRYPLPGNMPWAVVAVPPALSSAGAGVASATGPLAVPYPATVRAGDLLAIHVLANANDGVPLVPSGWLIAFKDIINGGGVPPGDPVQATSAVFTKVADGTETGTVSVSINLSRLCLARMYAFKNTSGFGNSATLKVASSTVFAPAASFTSSLPNTLVVTFGAIRNALTPGNFTGETGGDYVHDNTIAAPFSGSSATLDLQEAPLVAQGTITGGSVTITSSAFNVRSVELLPSTVVFPEVCRVLGVRPPMLVNVTPPTLKQQTVAVATVAVARRVAEQRRRSIYEFITPKLLAQPPPASGVLAVTLAAVRTRLENQRHEVISRLSPPTVILPVPTLREQTIRVTLAGRTRLENQRHDVLARLGPPTVIVPLPTLREQTIRVTLAGRTRLENQRHDVLARLGAPVVVAAPPTLKQQTIAVTLAIRTRLENQRHTVDSHLGAPTVVLPVPALREQTVRVTLAGRTRLEAARRAPRSVLRQVVFAPPLFGPKVVLIGRRTDARRHPIYRLAPPTVLAPLFGPAVTLTSMRRPELARHRPIYRLAPPTVILPLPTLRATIDQVFTVDVAVRTRVEAPRREPTYRLSPPTVIIPLPTLGQLTPRVAVFPAVRERLARLNRPARYRLGPPTVVLPLPTLREQTVRVTLALRPRLDVGRRRPLSLLSPPTVISRFVAPPTQVTLAAVRTRAEVPRHRPLYQLGEPTVVIPLPTRDMTTDRVLAVDVAVRTRIEAMRRRPRSFLSPPTVIVPLPPTEDQRHLRVTLVSVRTRVEARIRSAAHWDLGPPTVIIPIPTLGQLTDRVFATDVAVRTRTEAVRRHPIYRLGPPTVVLPVPALREQTIRATLVAVRTRVEVQRRAPMARLAPPTVILPVPTLREQTVKTTLVAVKTRADGVRRAPRSRLPSVIVFAPSLREQTIKTALAAVRTRVEAPRRAPRSRLTPPIFGTPSLAQQTIKVTLAGRTRLEATRRAPRFRLAPPIFPVPTLGQQTIRTALAAVRTRVEAPRHRTLYVLGKPRVLRLPDPIRGGVALTAVRTRLEAVRRAPHSNLGEPVVVRVPPTQREQTIRVTLAAVPLRAGLVRRAPHSHLAPPTVIAPPLAPNADQARLRVTLVAVAHRNDLRRRHPIWNLGPGEATSAGRSALTIAAASAATGTFLPAAAADFDLSAASASETALSASSGSELDDAAQGGSTLQLE